MNPYRRTLVALVALAPLAARAQPRLPVTELSPTQPVDAAAGRIEVLEFLWYGCIHCYNLEPRIDAWLKTLPKDVEFRRVPAVLSERWAHDAAIFYTFEALGVFDRLHRPFFDAIHRDRLRTDSPALSTWLEKQGIDPKKFVDTARSMGVVTRTKRAAQLTKDYRVDGTPAMAVQGRYTVGAHDGMLETVNQLVAVVRKNR